MSKAEELAGKAYPIGDTKLSDAAPSMCRNAFIEGYHQAEKNLELTWEDIELIVNIDQDTNNEESIIGVRKNEEHYQEVLKRFKERKGGMYKTWNSLRGNLKEDNQGNIVGGLKL